MANLRTRDARNVRNHTRASKTTAPKPAIDPSLEPLPPLPIDEQLWEAVIEALELSSQHTKVVELVLRGLSDKQIAQVMDIHRSTLRAYMTRIAVRTGANGRLAIMQKVLTVSHQVTK